MKSSIDPLAARVCAVIRKWKYAVLLFWAAFFGLGIYLYPLFLGLTDPSLIAPDGSPSSVATVAFDDAYGGVDDGQELLVLLTSVTGTSLTDLSAAPLAFAATSAYVEALSIYASNRAGELSCEANATSYYSLTDVYQPILATAYTADGGKSMYVYVLYTCSIDGPFLTDLRHFVEAHAPTDYVWSGVTGVELFQLDTLSGVEADLAAMDSIVLPSALVILALVLGNLPIMLVPVLSIGVTIAVEFALMYPIALVMQVVDFAPSVMVSLTIAMSIDYSLFLLSRVSEQLAKGETVETAIPEMLSTAGHTIIASGTTLCFCFLGLLFMPLEMLKSVGLGSALAILTALAVNLTLTPALLYTPLGDKLLRPPKILAMLCCAREGASRGIHSLMLDRLRPLTDKSEERRQEREALLADVGVDKGSLLGGGARERGELG